MEIDNGGLRGDAAAARRLIGEFLDPQTDSHHLDAEQMERLRRDVDAAAQPQFPERLFGV